MNIQRFTVATTAREALAKARMPPSVTSTLILSNRPRCPMASR